MTIWLGLLALSLALYSAGMICSVVAVLRPKGRAPRLAWTLFPHACVIHLLSFFAQWHQQAIFPLHTLLGAFSLYALLTLVGGVWFAWRSDSLAAAFSLGVIPWACLVLVFTLRFQATQLVTQLPPGFLSVHLFVTMVSFAAFSLAAGAGVLLLSQESALKQKRFGPYWEALPPLGDLDRETYRSIVVGFLFLGFAIVQGIVGAPRAWGRFWYNDGRLLSSIAVWLGYGLYLCARARYGWRGRRLALFAVIGFVLTLVTYVLINMGKVLFG